jgi:hypothetical protein
MHQKHFAPLRRRVTSKLAVSENIGALDTSTSATRTPFLMTEAPPAPSKEKSPAAKQEDDHGDDQQ